MKRLERGGIASPFTGQLDASLFYAINDHVQIGVQSSNPTDNVTKVLMGPSGYADGEVDSPYHRGHRGWFVNDRHYALVLRASG